MPFKSVVKRLLDTPPDPRPAQSKGKKKVERPGNEPEHKGRNPAL